MLEVDEDSRLGKENLLGGVRYGAARHALRGRPTADFYEYAVERLAAHRHRALRNLQFRAPRPRIAPQPEILDASSPTWASAPTPIPSMAPCAARIPNRSPTISPAPASAAEPAAPRPTSASSSACASPPASARRPTSGSASTQPIRRFVDAGLLETSDGMLRLTNRGVMLSNEVFQEFLAPHDRSAQRHRHQAHARNAPRHGRSRSRRRRLWRRPHRQSPRSPRRRNRRQRGRPLRPHRHHGQHHRRSSCSPSTARKSSAIRAPTCSITSCP